MILATEKNFKGICKILSEPGTYAVDTETTGLRPYHGDKLFSLIIATKDTEYYFNFQDYPAEKVKALPRELLPGLKPVLGNKQSKFYLSNAKFDMGMLAQDGLSIDGEIHDTEAVGRVLKNTHFAYGLDALAKQIGLKKDDRVDAYIKEHKLYEHGVDEETGEKTKKPCYWKVPFSLIAPYACTDTRLTWAVAEHQEAELLKQSKETRSPQKIFENEKALTPVLYRVEKAGLRVDLEYVRRALKYELGRVDAAKTDFEVFAEKVMGTEVEFKNSAKCFVPIFDAVGERYPLTEAGNPSFAKAALDGMSTPLAKMILVYREAQKISGTYYENFIYFADAQSRIHGNARQGGTKTGRLSYSEPNMQNLNKESLHVCSVCECDIEKVEEPCPDCGATAHVERTWMVRKSFIPSDGYFLLMVDYDQMEYRIMLDYAGEMGVIDQVLSGTDVHKATAKMMGVSRRDAKTINFMLLYGGGIAKLAQSLFKPTLPLETLKALGRKYIYQMMSYPEKAHHDLLIAQLTQTEIDYNVAELEKAYALLNQYYSALPSVKRFIKDVSRVAKDRGYISNWLGRRSYFGPGVPTHKAPNYLIQGGCADIVKKAMLELDALLTGKKSRMVLQVHDELIFEIHETERLLVPRIKSIMENAYRGKHLPLTCGVDFSTRSWGEKEEWNG